MSVYLHVYIDGTMPIDSLAADIGRLLGLDCRQ